MTVRIVIPVRPIEAGKSRLAGVLAPSQREALNHRLFDHVLNIATRAIPAAQCIVVSHSPALRALATAAGAQALVEQGASLNAALAQAAAFATAQGATAVLTLSTDLPLLSVAEVRAMLVPSGIAIAPDEAGTGTNALFLSPPGAIPYCYGPGSFAAHRNAARAIGVEPVIIRRPGLARDIDTPDDLARLDLD